MACRSHDKAANGNAGGEAAASAVPTPASAAKPARARHDCGQFDIRIGKDGTWYYRGSPIGRKELVCLFASVLKREPNGDYVLETPAERGRIEVEDAPFVAVELFWRECPDPDCPAGGLRQCLTFRTNLDEMVTADADHPIRVAVDPRTREPRPYVTVRPGLEARISRAVFYELAALAQTEEIEGRAVMGVWSEGVFFPIDEAPAEVLPPRRSRRGRPGELRSAAE
ncbi:MAG: DUF1285 domain-containing protein [Acetobacteraceae bacterium]|nr:DUF1285 domain-containing protein [Acetobacteraceae bacterium]MCX7684337.1 DUF1285 domain-containing protein [Acetobacteraceae bacterium]MDW8399518.1 DUF1285 domain-containing protein [Acetobacteraceae bacterium]